MSVILLDVEQLPKGGQFFKQLCGIDEVLNIYKVFE